MKRKLSATSDEGYNSDLPSPKRECPRDHSRTITRESQEFKDKYQIEKIINNSANGVIYQGLLFYDRN